MQELIMTASDGTILENSPWALISSHEDVLHYGGYIKSHDKEDFSKAMVKEVDGLQDSVVFHLVKRSVVDKSSAILPAIWSFRRKRNPAGEVLKHKARLNAHGGKQTQFVNYW